MENKTIKELVSQMDHGLCDIGLQIEKMNNIQIALGRMAEDACDKYEHNLQQYFLWDNNESLQILGDYIYHVTKDIKAKHEEVLKLQSDLFKTAKVGEVDKENTLKSGQEQGQ